MISRISSFDTGSGRPAAGSFEAKRPAKSHQILYYSELLQRYANRIVKNKLVAALITDEVVENYIAAIQINAPGLRQYLKQSTFNCCQKWLLIKSKTLYLRKPKNPT